MMRVMLIEANGSFNNADVRRAILSKVNRNSQASQFLAQFVKYFLQVEFVTQTMLKL
jgi:hypothetical protein